MEYAGPVVSRVLPLAVWDGVGQLSVKRTLTIVQNTTGMTHIRITKGGGGPSNNENLFF